MEFEELQKLENRQKELEEILVTKEGDVTAEHEEYDKNKALIEAHYKSVAEGILKQYQEKEKKFLKTNFSKDSDPAKLMQLIATGQFSRFYVEDFGYGEWEKDVPTGWDLERYFKAMSQLEELFHHLCYFQSDVSDYFPEQQLYVRWENGVIVTMDYITGQGSDFRIFLQPVEEKPSFDFVLDYNDAIDLCKKNAWKQALWYLKQIIPEEIFENDLSGYDLSMLMFRLGQLSANGSKGFVGMTKADWKEEIEKFKKD